MHAPSPHKDRKGATSGGVKDAGERYRDLDRAKSLLEEGMEDTTRPAKI